MREYANSFNFAVSRSDRRDSFAYAARNQSSLRQDPLLSFSFYLLSRSELDHLVYKLTQHH